jgi:hypothetical protein
MSNSVGFFPAGLGGEAQQQLERGFVGANHVRTRRALVDQPLGEKGL